MPPPRFCRDPVLQRLGRDQLMETYKAIATDYDGTLAHDGTVDNSTLSALRRARDAGLATILVTGRELPDLFNTFPHADLFDRIIAENGALLYRPASRQLRTLSSPPPARLLERLVNEAIPVSVGHSIVATVKPHERALLAAIRELGIEWHVIFNKGSVMALPAEVTKATGLAAALEEMDLVPEQVVGVGDAENDQAFLAMCGVSVAVANALPSVKASAALVTGRPRGGGVTELIERMLRGEEIDADAVRPQGHR
jgi:hydroxymethylpyrimidine pyrophosphatase-like HAD family hydrolase